MFSTYTGQSPANIREGDTVIDSLGRTFVSAGMPEVVLGDYHVNGYPSGMHELKSFTMDMKSTVTISFEEGPETDDDF